MRRLPALLLLIFATPAPAATEACLTSIAGTETALAYDSRDAALRENRSTREWLLGGYGRITCPGFVTLREMTPGLTDVERQPFCLEYDRKAGTYSGFSVGERDAWVECRAPSGRFCRTVNATTDTAKQVAGAIAGAATGGDASGEGGSSVIDRASGAVIATGAGSYISSTLGGAASAALAALSAPATLTAAAVTVVAVGGAVYVCGE